MHETLASDFADCTTLLDRPLSYPSPYYDKCYITARVTVGEKAVDIDLEGAPLAAHDDSWREKSGLLVPTRKEVGDGLIHGFSLVSGGTLIALKDGETYVTLRRDGEAYNFVDHLVEPSGCCGEPPSHTIRAELEEELFVLKTIGHEYRIASFAETGTGAGPDLELIERQAKMLESALALKGILPGDLLNRPVEPVAMKWNAADLGQAKAITVRSGSRVIEQFKSLAWFDEKENTLALRRSMVVDISREEVEGGKAVIYDGDGYGRHVVIGDRRSLAGDPHTPFLRQYLANSL